jgi:predicted TPR repeat methyltransferase
MDNKTKQAIALHQAHNFAAAEKIYREILVTDPKNCDVMHGLGMLLAQTERYSEALNTLKKALNADDKNPVFYNSYGNLLLRMEQFTEAIAAYKKCTALAPNYANGYSNLGNCYLQQKNYALAENSYRQALALNQDSRHVQFNLATTLAAQNKYDQAITALNKIIVASPNYDPAWEQLGQIYFAAENYDAASNAFQKHLELAPESAESWHFLAVTKMKAQDFNATISLLEKCIALDPKHKEAYFNLATCYLKLGDTINALKYYLQQLQYNHDIECYFNVGVIKMNQDQHKEAIYYFEKCLELNTNYLPAHQNLAAIFLKVQQIDKAIMHYEAMLAQNENDAEIKHILSALKQEEIPTQAPGTYITNLFDSYAEHYDIHLQDFLKYDVPKQIREALNISNIKITKDCNILDLGCGTGLSGEEFKDLSANLVGIDLSDKMLAVAKNRNIYKELICADINVAIKQYQNQDLIIAADVLSYFGALDTICHLVYNALNPGGIFACSVESGDTYPYILATTIRYQHHEQYIKEMLEKNNLLLIDCRKTILRKQHQGHIDGYIVIACKAKN